MTIQRPREQLDPYRPPEVTDHDEAQVEKEYPPIRGTWPMARPVRKERRLAGLSVALAALLLLAFYRAFSVPWPLLGN